MGCNSGFKGLKASPNYHHF